MNIQTNKNYVLIEEIKIFNIDESEKDGTDVYMGDNFLIAENLRELVEFLVEEEDMDLEYDEENDVAIIDDSELTLNELLDVVRDSDCSICDEPFYTKDYRIERKLIKGGMLLTKEECDDYIKEIGKDNIYKVRVNNLHQVLDLDKYKELSLLKNKADENRKIITQKNMVEILTFGDITKPFNSLGVPVRQTYKQVDNIYDYRVCEVTDNEFDILFDSDEELWNNCGLRYAKGSTMEDEFVYNGKINNCFIKTWDYKAEASDLFEYLSYYWGASQPRNVCSLCVDLARINDMTLGELFNTYQG